MYQIILKEILYSVNRFLNSLVILSWFSFLSVNRNYTTWMFEDRYLYFYWGTIVLGNQFLLFDVLFKCISDTKFSKECHCSSSFSLYPHSLGKLLIMILSISTTFLLTASIILWVLTIDLKFPFHETPCLSGQLLLVKYFYIIVLLLFCRMILMR